MFVDRESELASLNALLERRNAQFLVVYGRRRVGKTTLLIEWAKRSGLPYLYWVAARESSGLLLRTFSQAVYSHIHPEQDVDPLFSYPTWEMAMQTVANLAQTQQLILIIDEFPYLAEANPAIPSLLQNSWDHHFKSSQIALVLAGSQIGMMVDMLGYRAPLYGRATAQLGLKPLPFRAINQFFPRYTPEQCVAIYAMLGGIPAYLEKFDDTVSIGANVREQILSATSIFQHEPMFLLQDEVREPANYLAVIRAIGEGAHSLNDISLHSGLAKNHVSTYLARLQELTFVERQVPATLPKSKRTTKGRYVLTDAYLRFYFRFLAPNRILLEQGLHSRLWELISDGLRAFVGMTTFEELCRTWVVEQAVAGQAVAGHLPFIPDTVGRHWSSDCEIDVVAIHWTQRQIILGEWKWGAKPVGLDVIRSLIEVRGPKALKQLPGGEWTVSYIFFARNGFTEPARSYAQDAGARLVTLDQIDADLKRLNRV